MSNLPPPSWAPDPWGEAEERWWDGVQWTPFTRSSREFGPPLSYGNPTPQKKQGLGPRAITAIAVFLAIVFLVPTFGSHQTTNRAKPPPKMPIAAGWGSEATDERPATQPTEVPSAYGSSVKVFQPLLRWNPCDTINVRFSLDASPYEEEELGAPINSALEELAEVSSMNFHNSGFVSYEEAARSYPLNSSRGSLAYSSSAFKGVTIIFMPEGISIPPLSEEKSQDPVGIATSYPFTSQGGIYYADRGVIYLESSPTISLVFMKALLLHELGHVMGLDHSKEGAIMQPSLLPPSSWDKAHYSSAEAATLKNLLGGNGPCLLR